MHIKTTKHWVVAIALMVLSQQQFFMLAESASYRVAVVPQFTPVEISKSWQPVLEKISELSGVELELVNYPNIPSFENAFEQGEPDFAYMNPYHVVMANETQGYLPFVRDTSLLNGILVIHKDGGITSLSQLEGKTIAFPAPNAFGASLWMRAQLTQTHGLHFQEVYVGSHQTTYRQVLMGDVVAGGGIQSTLQKEPLNIQESLQILYRTPDVPSHPIVAHPRIDPLVVSRVKNAIMELASNPNYYALLKGIQLTKPVETEYKTDYYPLKSLKLESFVK